MSADEQIQLLEKLEALLERQIALAQEGNTGDVELLGRQADPLVGQIVSTGILGLPEFEDRRRKLHQLYDSLRLAVKTGEGSCTNCMTACASPLPLKRPTSPKG
jgi:hypothetical protein